VREGNRIRVPSGQQAKYLAAVADADALPPNFNTIQENALNKSGPWESGEATRQRLKIARQQTLSEIVRAMYWVENAVVLYDEHETRGLRDLGAVKQATASVSVRPRLGESLTPQRAKNIQKLVAHSVNMNAKDVAVTNLGEGGPAGQEGEMTFDSFDDDLMKTKVAFEMQKRESILGALRDIPGVSVQVNADFNDTVEETRNVTPDPKTATQSETTRLETTNQSVADNGGRPGATANGPLANRTTDQAQRQNTNETKSDTTETRNVVGVKEVTTSKKNLTPREVWATVTVPSSYIKSLWTTRNPTNTTPPKPEDLSSIQTDVVQKVENIVDTLLYIQAIKAGDTYKHVRVVVLDSLPAPTIEPPSIASKAVAWTGQYWSTVAMLGVAMFSLMVLRSVVNGKPGDTSGAATPASALTLQSDEPAKAADSADSNDSDRPRLKLRKGNSLKDDLMEIVRDDPDAAADILRSWISKAG